MSILTKLTLRHLKMNRKRTIMTIVGIVLSVAIVTAISGFIVSFQDLLYREAVNTDGLWHVRYSGVSQEVSEQILQDPTFSEGEVIQTEDGPVLLLLFSTLDKDLFTRSDNVCQTYGISSEKVRYNSNLLIAKGIVSGNYYNALYGFAAILLTLVGIGSVLVISNAFTISIDQRSRQFGMLKSVGATRHQLRNMVLLEGWFLAACAIPLGLLAGIGVQWTALTIANSFIARIDSVNLNVSFRVVFSLATMALAVAAALITVLLSAWIPARRASKISAIEAIRQTRSVKISTKNVRVSPLMGKLFGFEGMLAAKTLRRNRSKYRTTILSLVISIVLFIGVSSFADVLTKATSMVYETYDGTNVMLSMRNSPAELHDQLAETMASWEDVSLLPVRCMMGNTTLPQGALTTEYQKHFPDQTPDVQLFSLGDEQYAQLCRDLSLSQEQLEQPDSPGGILINTSGTIVRQGRRIDFVPYKIPTETQLPLDVQGQQTTLRVAGVTSDLPPGVSIFFSSGCLNIVVPDSVYRSLHPDLDDEVLYVVATAGDSAAFTEKAALLMEQQLPLHSWSATNYDKVLANNRNLVTLVMVFVYGFIAMLSLVGITNVVTTISTNISLRSREFAMLQSVGMTEQSVGHMLRYESVFYGVRALAWGIPLGLGVSFLLYYSMTQAMAFPFIWPVSSIIIAAIAVFFLSLSTMIFARKKQQKANIVDALRQD